ncbi:TatD family hydrolase [soil metagenome]
MYVDSHCHLSSPELLSRIDEIRAAMSAERVDRALVVCTTLEGFAEVHALATRFDNFWCSAGVHPDEENVAEPSVETLLDLAAKPRVVGIGETGLDYFRLNGRSIADMEWQRERFRAHIRASTISGLPLIIHTRSASEDTLAVLKEEGGAAGLRDVPGVFHCFTETAEVARAALDLGFMISFSGILTFKNAADLREVAKMVPLDRCLIETDSPYLAPVPYRGKVNNPSYVPHVARQIAAVKGCSVEEVAEVTTRNFDRLFPLAH